MEEEFKSEDYQGRSKDQVERTYKSMKIIVEFVILFLVGFLPLFITILLTHTLFKFIIE